MQILTELIDGQGSVVREVGGGGELLPKAGDAPPPPPAPHHHKHPAPHHHLLQSVDLTSSTVAAGCSDVQKQKLRGSSSWLSWLSKTLLAPPPPPLEISSIKQQLQTRNQCAETDNERVKLLAVQAVRDIACTPSLQLKLADVGGAEAIANLLTPPKYDAFWLQTISKAAAEALSAMCYGQPSVKRAVADSGAIPHLVELANIYQTFPKNNNSFDKGHKLEAAGLAAARVLCSLADVDDVKYRLGQGGAIAVLTRMLDEDDNPAEAHKYAAATLAKICVGC